MSLHYDPNQNSETIKLIPRLMYYIKTYMSNIPLAGVVGAAESELTAGG